MYFLVGCLASLVVVQAAPFTGHYTYPAETTLVRSPEHDSAVVRSDRFGGNFAYSIAQRHAYQVFSPNSGVIYNHDPFSYSHHQFSQFPYVANVNGHHFYIQHPLATPIVPSFVSVVYPGQNPSEYPEEDQTEPTADSEPTENPDAETVEVVAQNGSNDVPKEETTEENNYDEPENANDDSIAVDAYRLGGDN
ncbi:hypothetical protein Bhyg_16626 [Pseudolycoriella hygida]|uniref:Uncharacterized protein n=1 Tax=Pseudolycoriella hygida TaxID=35572 RepID=A0A9Q0ML93_9DIPT|nr:hypothetical protein Bhyg_16626 [Pseudolycoriella hygida]